MIHDKKWVPGPRWVRSKYSELIYHATIPNYADPDKTVILELEGTDEGRVYVAIRNEDGVTEHGGARGFRTYDDAAQFALREFALSCQNKRKSHYVLDFTPLTTDKEFRTAFEVSQATANAWKRRSYKVPMTRKSVNAVLAAIGYRRSGKGMGVTSLGAAWWDDEGSK